MKGAMDVSIQMLAFAKRCCSPPDRTVSEAERRWPMKQTLGPFLMLLIGGCTTEAFRTSGDGPARLAQELRGRLASASQTCVNQHHLRANRSVGPNVLIFEGPGTTIYVNRTKPGCPNINFGRALVRSSPSFRLCEGDYLDVIDPSTGGSHGSCQLGPFTAYRPAS